ncbi:hypothetical protein D3C84_1119410 [compost metagenome]
MEVADEIHTVLRNLNVDRVGVLLANGASGKRCRTEFVLRVFLDYQHRSLEVRIHGQEVSDRAADHSTTDDDHIIAALAWLGGQRA